MPFLCGLSSHTQRPHKNQSDKDHATAPHKTSTTPSSPHVTSTAPSSPYEISPAPSCQVTDSTTDASMSVLSHDIEHSILHRLPLDLLYHLTKHHLDDTADILALRATSRAFCTPLLTPTGPASISASRSFVKRMNYDRFTRACAAEREQPRQQQQQANNERPCSACVNAHPPSLFSAAQLARAAPEERRCKGAEGVMRMCRHRAFTYDELASKMTNVRADMSRVLAVAREYTDLGLAPLSWLSSSSRDWFLTRWECPHCPAEAADNADSSGHHHHRRLWARDAEMLISSGTGTENFGPWARSKVVVAVGEVRRDESLTLERVMGVLAAVEESGVVAVCRHVRFADPRTFRTRPANLGDGEGRNGQVLISSHECLDPSCHMLACLFWNRKRLFRDTAPGEPVVLLEITRRLGQMRSPSSERWLAQMEEEG